LTKVPVNVSFTPRYLRELDARFIRLEVVVEKIRRVRPEVFAVRPTGPFTDDEIYEWEGPCDRIVDVDAIGQADGIRMLCPKCYDDPPIGPVGTHSLICWSPTISQDHSPKPGRWNLVGTSIDDLTLVAGSSSVLLQGGCDAHFFVRNGRAVPC
jgi:hypothetical protein